MEGGGGLAKVGHHNDSDNKIMMILIIYQLDLVMVIFSIMTIVKQLIISAPAQSGPVPCQKVLKLLCKIYSHYTQYTGKGKNIALYYLEKVNKTLYVYGID